MVGLDRPGGVGAAPHLAGRDDVDGDERGDRLGMVERQAVGDAPAAVVAGNHEARMPQRAHDGQAVLGHGALGIDGVLGVSGRRGAGAVAAQIGNDQSAVAGELRGDLVPDDVGLRIAVQQQQRRAGAAGAGVDFHIRLRS